MLRYPERCKPKISDHLGLLVCEFLVVFVIVRQFGARQFERICNRCPALFYAGNQVGAPEPVGFGKIGRRPLRRMVGMRVIEADDLLAALAPVALNANQFPGIDAITVVWRVVTRIAAANTARNGPPAIVPELSEQHAATLVRISFLSVLTKRDVGRL